MGHILAWFWDQVWPNLVASMICFSTAFIVAHRHFIRPIHRKLDRLHAQIGDANDANLPGVRQGIRGSQQR